MATSIEDLKTTMDAMAQQLAGVQDMAKQFTGFQQVMTTTLDKLNDLEAWRSIVETSMGSMMQQSKETTTRVQQLEARPPPPPPPPPAPLPHPPPSITLLHPPPPMPNPLVPNPLTGPHVS
jgi:hypothetical protein